MKKIPLTKNKFALVDGEDYAFLMQWKWQISTKGYAVRSHRIGERKYNKKIAIWMHRVINNTPNGMFTDHVNRNKLDNRKCNLRSATGSQNLGNINLSKHNTSGFKGVSWCKERQLWEVYITKKDRKINLGRFKDKSEAAKTYNKAAIHYFGQFAQLNNI